MELRGSRRRGGASPRAARWTEGWTSSGGHAGRRGRSGEGAESVELRQIGCRGSSFDPEMALTCFKPHISLDFRKIISQNSKTSEYQQRFRNTIYKNIKRLLSFLRIFAKCPKCGAKVRTNSEVLKTRTHAIPHNHQNTARTQAIPNNLQKTENGFSAGGKMRATNVRRVDAARSIRVRQKGDSQPMHNDSAGHAQPADR